MKKVKQILSLLLCLIICIGLPSTVQAAEYQPTKIMINFVRSDNSGTYQAKDYIPYGVNYGNINEIKQLNFTVFTDGSISCNSGDLVNISIKQTYNRYAYSFSMPAPYSYIRATDKNGNEFRIAEGKGVYENYNFKFVDVSIPRDCTIDSIVFAFDPRGIQYKDWTNSQACGIGFSDCTVTVESEQTGFFNSIKEFFQQLFEKLTNGLDNIGNWFTELGNKIKSFFTELGNNIKEQFTNMINNLKSFFADVGQWFKDIGDKIGEFFEKLWNRIWWGNENGESEYQKPVINNKLNDILDTLNGYQLQLKNTIDTISSSADSVSTYISTGTQLVNGIINVAGVGFTALIVFAIVFVLARKVVGR